MSRCSAKERKLYEKLSPDQLKELAQESEALVAKARAMASGTYTPNGATETKQLTSVASRSRRGSTTAAPTRARTHLV